MSKQAKQCAYWFLVIHEKAKCFSFLDSVLKNLLDENPNFEFSYILHEPDDDCPESIHYHVVLYFKGKVKRFTTIQTLFEGAHIEQSNQQRYKRCIQYLVHKNNPEKKQYKQSDIVSNIPIVDMAEILNSEGYDFELFREELIFEYMNDFYSVNYSVSMNDFVKRFGLSGIAKYYFIIKDMIKDFTDKMAIIKSRFSHADKTEIAWSIYSKDFKKDWQIASYYGYTNLTFEEALDSQYKCFIDDVEKGLLDVDSIINGKELI